MALMGTTLWVTLACAAVLIPLVTVFVWSRLRGPLAVRAIIRFFLLILGQVVTVALVGVLANNYGQFYTSWSDLFGTDHTPPIVAQYGAHTGHKHRGAATVVLRVAENSIGTQTGVLRLLGATNWSTPAQRDTRGEIQSAIISGYGSGLSNQAFIYLPPQYFSPKYAHFRFPAVETLTGYPGSAQNLVDIMDYPSRALAMVRAHEAKPMIYVMLRSTAAPPRDTECTNIANGPQAETFLGHELISAVEHGLRVQPGHWGVIGDSTGGYCAAKLAMAEPSVYAGGVSLSGYYHALNGGTAGNLFGGSLQLQHENDMRWLLRHRPIPPASLYVTISKQETNKDEGYEETMRFLHEVKPPMSVTAAILKSGGHNFATWDRELPKAMRWLAEHIDSPTKPAHRHHHCHHDAAISADSAHTDPKSY
ncbi:alpha/beta hydrolase [Flexivirga caeni]|nr:alpha/beta hydrolase-fold protein [Flexivirga caeni]